MQFRYITYIATPLHKNLCHREHEIYNFGRPFLGHHYYTLYMHRSREEVFFKEIHQFYPKITSPLGW